MSPDRVYPDHSTCRNCGKAISWDDYSYTHDASGFADCGVTVSGGQHTTLGAAAASFGLRATEDVASTDDVPVILDPSITSDGRTTHAEPVEWS